MLELVRSLYLTSLEQIWEEKRNARVVGSMATDWIPVVVVLTVAAAVSQGHWSTITWTLMES